MDFSNLKIVGTSHIARQSLAEIEAAFIDFRPTIVGVELDRGRLHALFSKEPERKASFADIRHIGVKGYLFATIGRYVQKKLGNIVGVAPGSEMKLAVELAKKNNLKTALIDQDIQVTLKRFSKALSWREKFRFLGDMLGGIFFKKRKMKEMGIENFDLSKVPDKVLVSKLIAQLKVRYPNVYRVLVEERNVFMASNIAKLLRKFPEDRLLVVVGAGHEEELFDLIKKKYNLVDVVSSAR